MLIILIQLLTYLNQQDPRIRIKLMHSASTRFNGITLFTGTVLGVMCLINFLQGWYMFNKQTNVHFQINSITNFINTTKWDQASFKYTLQTDLSPLYNWNLKQLFVYIECEWVEPTKNLTSRTIVSDLILQIPENKEDLQKAWTINLQNERLDYLVRDVHHSFRGATLKFSLNVEYMPIVGFFFKSRLFEMNYTMPNHYSNEAVK